VFRTSQLFVGLQHPHPYWVLDIRTYLIGVGRWIGPLPTYAKQPLLLGWAAVVITTAKGVVFGGAFAIDHTVFPKS
jgi:hypothetical protein